MPTISEIAAQETKDANDWNSHREKFMEEVELIAKKHNKTLLSHFVHRAFDEGVIVSADRIFDFIDKYVDGETND